MHMICPSMPIPASTKLTNFLYISCRKKITAPPFGAPSECLLTIVRDYKFTYLLIVKMCATDILLANGIVHSTAAVHGSHPVQCALPVFHTH